MDLRTNVELGELTLNEAAELSRALEERWGARLESEREQGDLITDFVLPLVERLASQLTPPDAHLAAIRSSIARAVAR